MESASSSEGTDERSRRIMHWRDLRGVPLLPDVKLFVEKLEDAMQKRLQETGFHANVTLGGGAVHWDPQWKRAKDLKEVVLDEWQAVLARDKGLFSVVKRLSEAVAEALKLGEHSELFQETVVQDFEATVYQGIEVAWNSAVAKVEKARLRGWRNEPVLLRAHKLLDLKIAKEEGQTAADFYSKQNECTFAAAREQTQFYKSFFEKSKNWPTFRQAL